MNLPDDEELPQCSEGGLCEFLPDIEYDITGGTINCRKCGNEPETR